MKEFKGFLFYTIVFYAIICSFLVIKIHNRTYNNMQIKFVFSSSKEFNDFINQSRKTLNNYKKNAKNEETRTCINSVEKYIDFYDKLNNSGIEISYLQILRGEDYFIYEKMGFDDATLIYYDCTQKSSGRLTYEFRQLESEQLRIQNTNPHDLFYSSSSVRFNDVILPDYYLPNDSTNKEIYDQFERNTKRRIEKLLEIVGELNEE